MRGLPLAVFDSVMFFASLGVVETVERANEVASNAANTLKLDAMAYHLANSLCF